MTIICWKDGILAADSLCLYGSHRANVPHKKIKMAGKNVYGSTGSGALFDPMIRWVEDGAEPEKCPNVPNDTTRLLVFTDGRCISYRIGLPYAEEYHSPDAWGSEAEFACGAMAAGASAEEAVHLAIKHTNTVGGPVEVIDLQSCDVFGHDFEAYKDPRGGYFGECKRCGKKTGWNEMLAHG